MEKSTELITTTNEHMNTDSWIEVSVDVGVGDLKRSSLVLRELPLTKDFVDGEVTNAHNSIHLRVNLKGEERLCVVVVVCGVVWCGVVWCGVVWCGVVWCGVVWCGVMW